ncbi:MAG: hypothetical protein WBX00_16540 [Isosphaeraceae bacterium]
MSETRQLDDIHAPDVKRLVEADDWASLARYWIAHLRNEAPDRAIELLRARGSASNGTWRAVADYLQLVRRDPMVFRKEPPDLPFDQLDPAEGGTIFVLYLFPWFALCTTNLESLVF